MSVDKEVSDRLQAIRDWCNHAEAGRTEPHVALGAIEKLAEKAAQIVEAVA